MTDVSHGRGGAGNMTPQDKTEQYVDGEIVRYGVEGSHGDGAFSSGRGGVANITDRGKASTPRNDRDLVPDMAVRPGSAADHHVGRGGAGNAVKDKEKEKDSAEVVTTTTMTTEPPAAAAAVATAVEEADPRAIDHDRKMFEEHKASAGGAAPVRGLADKLKDKILRRK